MSTTTKAKATAAGGRQAAGGAVRVGIGGWTYEPWRDNFYPKGLAHSRELEYASRRLTAIEINGTYYRLQSRTSFAKWRDETPDGFVFSLKASRYTTNRRVLAEAGESIDKFFASGVAELGDKLGPVVWQFAPTKRFDADDFGAFLALLPSEVEGVPVRHALEVRHDSFKCPEFIELARRHGAATVFTDSPDFPSISDQTGGFVYARLMNAEAGCETGYAPDALDRWHAATDAWREGRLPDGLSPLLAKAQAEKPGDVFVFFINGAKEHAPAAAISLLQRLGFEPPAN